MNIDIHAHVIPFECFDSLDRNTVASERKLDWDLETRLKVMEETGVDIEAISVRPTSLNKTNADEALKYSRRINDGIARMVSEYPKHFIGFADIPLHDPVKATKELDRAVTQLGMRGIQLMANCNGHDLGELDLDDFFREVEHLDIPVFIHPHPAMTNRTGKYHLNNLIGNPWDTTLAAAHLIFGGVIEKFPGIKFVLAHAGGLVPYLMGRWEHGFNVRDDTKVIIKEPPGKYLSSFYFDTITHSDSVLEFLIGSVGANRVVLGTDFPADMADSIPVERVKRLKRISRKDKLMILGENATRLLKI